MAESPLPMPRTMRPPDSSWQVAAAQAVVAGWRVAVMATLVASRMVVVVWAAMPMATNGSPVRFCDSPQVMPSHPWASALAAWRAKRRGRACPYVQNSGVVIPAILASK